MIEKKNFQYFNKIHWVSGWNMAMDSKPMCFYKPLEMDKNNRGDKRQIQKTSSEYANVDQLVISAPQTNII